MTAIAATVTLTAPCPNPACNAVLTKVAIGGRERRFTCACGWRIWVAENLRVWDVEPWGVAVITAAATATKARKR